MLHKNKPIELYWIFLHIILLDITVLTLLYIQCRWMCTKDIELWPLCKWPAAAPLASHQYTSHFQIDYVSLFNWISLQVTFTLWGFQALYVIIKPIIPWTGTKLDLLIKGLNLSDRYTLDSFRNSVFTVTKLHTVLSLRLSSDLSIRCSILVMSVYNLCLPVFLTLRCLPLLCIRVLCNSSGCCTNLISRSLTV